MLKLRLLLPYAVLLLASCGNDTTKTADAVDTTADSIAAIDSAPHDSVPVDGLALKMGGDTIAPADKSKIFYSFTKKMIDKKGKALVVSDVRTRFMPLDPACDGEAAHKLNRFFTLDSLKKAGKGKSFDIGEIVSVNVALLDTIRKTADGCWVTWRMDYSTAESCPYAEGTFFMLSTYDAKGKNISTQCMARSEGGSDAPISWTSLEVCNVFQDGSYRSLYSDTTEDVDENDKPVYSVMRKTYTGQISAAGKITRTEEEIERTK